MVEDSIIIKEIKSGKTACYALLIERYHRPLLAYIFKIVGDKDLVEDIGQEVFLSAYKSLGTFDEHKGLAFSSWLFTIAKNRSISMLRKRKMLRLIGLDDEDMVVDNQDNNPEERVLIQERLAAVATSLEQIPEPFRKTMEMSLAGVSMEGIAASERITIGTVKSRLFRAKERMRLLVAAYFGAKVGQRL